MKDDANLVILAAHVAEISHSLWLKTTSSLLKPNAEREVPMLAQVPASAGAQQT
jgi:hypothetical protein